MTIIETDRLAVLEAKKQNTRTFICMHFRQLYSFSAKEYKGAATLQNIISEKDVGYAYNHILSHAYIYMCRSFA